MNSLTPPASSWSRVLCLPIFVGVVFFACCSMAAFSEAFNANTTRNVILAVASSIVATLLGGLALSLARGRGVPNWFMRTFMLFCLSLILLLPLQDIQNWWQGKPFDLDSVFLYTIILMTMTGDFQIWKTLWYFRSKEAKISKAHH